MPMQIVGKRTSTSLSRRLRGSVPPDRKFQAAIAIGVLFFVTVPLVEFANYSSHLRVAAEYNRSPGCGGAAVDPKLSRCDDAKAVVVRKKASQGSRHSYYYLYCSAVNFPTRKISLSYSDWAQIPVGAPVTLRRWQGKTRAVVFGSSIVLTKSHPLSEAKGDIGLLAVFGGTLGLGAVILLLIEIRYRWDLYRANKR